MTEERYEIRGKIGQGGVGAVYKAYDTQLRREVAIKRVLADEEDTNNEQATANLLKEATALSSVQHPHICTVYDAGIDDEGPFVVMELINGKTLDMMVEKGTLTYEDFREVAIQSQEAMIAAQELNIVHRDLKPSNVMVSWLPSGRFQVKLVDFGLAKFSAKPSLQTIDHGDAVFGSIFFMAPEQFERTPLDQRTDMYSLGAMFYYSLTGNYPFDGESAPQVMASHLQNTVIPLQQVRPDLPVWLCEWVMWHIQRDMNHRPNSAKDALKKFLADETLAAQGGLGTTQQLITPGAPRTNTGPLLIVPQGGNAQNTTGHVTGPLSTQPPLVTSTAPQPILTPAGVPSTHSSTQRLQPASGIQTALPTNPATSQQLPPVEEESKPMSAIEEAAYMAAQKKPMSKKKLITISSIIVACIIVTIIIIIGKNKGNKDIEEYNQLVEGIEQKTELKVDHRQLGILLKTFKETPANKAQRVFMAIHKSVSKDGSFSVAQEIASYAVDPSNTMSKESRQYLFRASANNQSANANTLKALLDYAVNNPDSPAASETLSQLKGKVDNSFTEDILKVHDKTTSNNNKNLCTILIKQIITNTNTKDAIAKILIDNLNASLTDPQRLSYIRMLGTTGSKKALAILLETLKSDNPSDVQAAMKGLSSWPDDQPVEAMIEAYSNSSSGLKRLRQEIQTLLTSFSDPKSKVKPNRQVQLWKDLINSTATIEERKYTIWKIAAGESNPVKVELLNYIIADKKSDEQTIEKAKETLERWK